MSDINSHYEDLAERFRRDTGLTAPGKDRAPAEGEQFVDGHRVDGRELVERWNAWLAEGPDSSETLHDEDANTLPSGIPDGGGS